MVIAIVMVFAFTTTAFAIEWADSARWSSSVCLYGFTTRECVDKNNCSWFNWHDITPWVYELSFARTPDIYNLRITPKTGSGLIMGDTVARNPNSYPDWILINNYKSNNEIYLRIDNPNTGNNTKSMGYWDSAIE
jgi:hypothetical protein